MTEGRVYYSFAWGMLLCLCSFYCKSEQRNESAFKDTNVLARNEKSFTINSDTSFYQAGLISTGQNLSGTNKILLLLGDPRVMQNPDGVYEVYASREAIDAKMLSSTHPGFVNVLDLYALTVNNPPNYLSVDLTKRLAELAKDGQPIFPVTVTIVFRGNALPDSSKSTQAGRLSVKGMRIVQEK